MSASEPVTVALVGRPNVGKSRLFNRLTGRRVAIVHDQPGVTRDVNAFEMREGYTLLDTGGIGLVAEASVAAIVQAAEAQVFVALEAARLICLLVDGREGLAPMDAELAARLRDSGKPVLLVVNKIDAPEMEGRADEFAQLGLGEGMRISAEHGRGVDALRHKILDTLGPLPPRDRKEDGGERRLRLAFVGRPNVGKSSLCNRLVASDRLVVSEVPGTTRDAVELNLDFAAKDGERWPFRLIDTAGMRRAGKVKTSVDYFSGVRTRRAIEWADVVFLVIDAREGVSRMDKALCGEIVEAGKCVAVLVNKWDLALETFERDPLPGYESEGDFRKKFAEAATRELFFLPDSPVLFVSAKTGFSVERVLAAARVIDGCAGQTLQTGHLNRLVQSLLKRREPRLVGKRRFKVYYAVQTGTRPVRVRLYCNQSAKLDDNYKRYLQHGFMREFNLQGCPLRFDLVGKETRAGAASARGK